MYKFQTKKLAAKTGSKVDLGKERNQKVGLHLMRYDLSYAKVMSCALREISSGAVYVEENIAEILEQHVEQGSHNRLGF